MRILADVVELYIIVVFIRVIFSWIPTSPSSQAGKVAHVFVLLTDPLLRPIRRIVPPLRFGGMAIDLAPLILLIALEILHAFL